MYAVQNYQGIANLSHTKNYRMIHSIIGKMTCALNSVSKISLRQLSGIALPFLVKFQQFLKYYVLHSCNFPVFYEWL